MNRMYFLYWRKYIELFDVFASLAPHPISIETGEKDRIYPNEGSQKAIPIIKNAYQETGHPDKFLADVRPRGHEFNGDKMYPFMLKHLNKEWFFRLINQDRLFKGFIILNQKTLIGIIYYNLIYPIC